MGKGSRILDGLRDAVAGNLSAVTIEGETWVKRGHETPEHQLMETRGRLADLHLENDCLRSENASLREDISRYVSRDTERLAEVEKLREALQVVNDYLSSDWFPHKSRTGTTKSEAAYAVRAVLTGTEAPEEDGDG